MRNLNGSRPVCPAAINNASFLPQENMSDKSQSEHQKLMNVLILDAYLPVLLIVVPAANYFVCLVRQESLYG